MLKIKRIGSELSIWVKQLFRFKNCWILLPGFLAIVLVYAVHHFNVYPWIATKLFHENLAPWLVLTVFMILLTAIFISREPLMIYLAVLALVFLVRELDHTVFTAFSAEYLFKSKDLLYFLLIGMGLWAWGWHEKLFASLNRAIFLKVLFFGVLWTYFFSQLIARRWFKGILPDEELLHIPLEETAETAAHLFFIVYALVCLFYYCTRRASQVQIFSPTAEPEDTAGQFGDVLD
jgi:hypothetical protein